MKELVLAIDPGMVTGVALINRETLECLHLGEYTWQDCVRYVAETLRDNKGNIEVVVERFIITQQTAKNSAKGAGYAYEMIGMVRLLCWQYDAGEFSMQSSSDAINSSFTNKRLQELGWWKRGSKDHCRMAAKHAGVHMVRTGCKNRALLGLESD